MDEQKTHLAIFTQPFLDLIFSGEKTIESRFSKNKIAPFGKVKTGDKVIIKESGGLVYGEFIAGEVTYLSEYFGFMNPKEINVVGEISLAKKYDKEICSNAVSDFWESRKSKKYATLIKITQLKKYKTPRHCYEKNPKDRRSWIILN